MKIRNILDKHPMYSKLTNMKKTTKQTQKKDVAKAVTTTKKSMPITSTDGNKKVYPEAKRTRVVDTGYLGKGQGLPKKLIDKNKTK